MYAKLRILALCSTALVSTSVLAQTAAPTAPVPGAPPAAAVFDLQQLPAFKGKVQMFTLSPRGDIDGLLLVDGTEVKLPPHLTAEIAAAVKVGDVVTVRGLKAASLPLIAASSVANDATNVVVVDNGPQGRGKKDRNAGGPKGGPRAAIEGTPTDLQGRVKVALHGRKGEVNGVLLEDGTILRLPPPEAARLAAMLVPGQSIAVRGTLRTTPYGKFMEVRALGATLDKLSEVQGPPPGGKKGGPKGPKG